MGNTDVMIEHLKSLHACWCETTKQDLNYRATERIFYELHNSDFTVDDLKAVLHHVLNYNRTHPHCQMKVQLHRLCGDLEIFASICAEAKSKERNKVKPATPREIVLHEWRRSSPETNGNVRPIAEVFNAMREATKQ